jgi:hypothetical protein
MSRPPVPVGTPVTEPGLSERPPAIVKAVVVAPAFGLARG